MPSGRLLGEAMPARDGMRGVRWRCMGRDALREGSVCEGARRCCGGGPAVHGGAWLACLGELLGLLADTESARCFFEINESYRMRTSEL